MAFSLRIGGIFKDDGGGDGHGHRRQPLLIFGSNIAAGLLLTLPISIFLIRNLQRSFSLTEMFALFITLLVVISNFSSAITVRMCAEVKIASGAIDMSYLFIVSLSTTASSEQSTVDHLSGLLLVVPPVLVVGAYSLRALARLLNRLHPPAGPSISPRRSS